ncbi:MAG: type II toxin-antitoxin system VapC family toxin [Pseudomonadota bacterium]
MKVTPDTNVLVRALTRDDPRQSRIAEATLLRAETVALTLPTLCELVWVLSRLYRRPPESVAMAIRTLIGSAGVVTDAPAAEAGLEALEAGGDFADAVIAHEGRRLGGAVFVSFDRKAVALLKSRNQAASLLA